MLRQAFAVLCVLTLSLNALAQEVVLYDSQGFEAPLFEAGLSPVGQPASEPEENQWIPFGGSPDAFEVASGVGTSGSQAIQANGRGENDGNYVWPNLGYTPETGEKVRIRVDIARTLSVNVARSSPVYAVEIFDADFNRTSRFGLQQNGGEIRAFISVPIAVANGPIVPGGELNRSEYYGPAFAENQFVHFDFLMDYTAKTVTMSLDNNLLAVDVPFRTLESEFVDSAELQVGTFDNESDDNGYFDNYLVSVTTTVPGDFDTDNDVDGEDFLIWQRGGSPSALSASDLSDWQSFYGYGGNSPLTATTAVPEPSSVLIALLATPFGLLRRRRS